MALKLKEGKTITDSSGNVYDNAYLVIDQNNGNKKSKLQHIVVEIYKDQESRRQGKRPIDGFTRSYEIQGVEFDTWFSPEAVEADSNHYSQAYAYIKQVRSPSTFSEVEDEEVETLGELVYEDWEDLP